MLSAKLLSCLAVVSAIVVASYEVHAEVPEPDKGSKVLTLPSSAISQHDTMRSLRTADAAVAKANEERGLIADEAAEKVITTATQAVNTLKATGQARTDAAVREAVYLNGKFQRLIDQFSHHIERARLNDIQRASDEYRLRAIELSEKSVSVQRESNVASTNFFNEGLDRYVHTGNHAAGVNNKLSDYKNSEEYNAHLVREMYQMEKEIGDNYIKYISDIGKITADHNSLKLTLKESFLNRADESLAGDVDKSKAAAPNDQIDAVNHIPPKRRSIGEENEPIGTKGETEYFQLWLKDFDEHIKAAYMRYRNQAEESLVKDAEKSKAAAPNDQIDAMNHTPPKRRSIGEENEPIGTKGETEYFQLWLKDFDEHIKAAYMRYRNQAEESLVKDAEKSKAAAPNDQIDKGNHTPLKRKRVGEDIEPIDKHFQQWLKNFDKHVKAKNLRLRNQAAEGLVGGVDKSEAAAGAHAGTVHAAV